MGLNPAGGKILPEPKRRFIAQSLSSSPFHRPEMTEILLKGRKTLTHPFYHTLHSLLSAPLLPVPSHPLPSPLIAYPTLPYPSGLSLPNPTILSLLLLFPRIPSPTYLPSHPYPTLAFPTLRSPRIPSLVPYLTISIWTGLGAETFPSLPLP